MAEERGQRRLAAIMAADVVGYMNKLFDVGFAMAKSGYPWEKFPPGYNPDD